MNVLWHKVWYDLWRNKVRTGLAVLSIAAGVFAVGAIFGMTDQLLSGMDSAHQSVLPSHMNMFLDARIDRDTARSLNTIEGVEDVDPYNQISVQYKIRPDATEWKQGAIAQRDYTDQKYDLFILKEGRWPGRDEIGIERLTSQYFGVDIGDSVIFKVGNSEKAFPIAGKIRHPWTPPPSFGGEAVFFMDGATLERFNVPDGLFADLRVRVKPYSADYAREVSTRIKERLAKQGVNAGSVQYQDPQKHWGRFYVEGITLVMQVLAIVSLFTSVILVLNTLTALIAQQTDQIGILKAIGGSTGAIVQVYLIGVLIYGFLALVISLPLGVTVAYAMTRWFLNLFNVDYEVFRVSSRAVTYQVLAAIIVPLLAGLWPILSGALITVRQAIASYGLGGNFGSSWLDRGVEHLGQKVLPSHYAMALGNLFRRKPRLILTLLVLVTAGTMFLMVMSLSSSITLTLNNDFARRGYDMAMYFRNNQRMDRVQSMAQTVNGVQRAVMIFAQPVTIFKSGQRLREAGLGAQILGAPLGENLYTPLIVAGRWLQPGDGYKVVMNRKTAEDNHINLSDTITLDMGALGKHDWEVIGLYQVIFGGDFSSDTLYAPQDAVLDAAKKYSQAYQAYVWMDQHNGPYANVVTAQLKKMFEGRGMDVAYSQTVYENRKNAESQFGISTTMLLALAVIVALVGGIGLMGALSIAVVERTKEIGVMRAIGARSTTIMGMFLLEGILQGVLSWAIAVPLSFAISQPLAYALGQVMFQANLDFQYNLLAVGVWLVVIVVISTLASILPARNATTISVRDSLAYS